MERSKEREMEEGRDKMNGEKTIRPSMLFCGVGGKGEGGNEESERMWKGGRRGRWRRREIRRLIRL